MPTIVALDVGLSMQRTIPGRSEENSLTYVQLASKGIGQLLDYLSLNSKLEYVCLVTFGAKTETKVDFTRDYDLIKQALKKIESSSTTHPVSMLKTCANLFATNWGVNAKNGTIVVFTACCPGFGAESLPKIRDNYGKETFATEHPWLENIKQYNINFICVGLRTDITFQSCLTVYEETLQTCQLTNNAKIYAPKPLKDLAAENNHKNLLGRTVMFEMVDKCCEDNFKQFDATLKCGGYFRLECAINLWPPPQPYTSKEDPSQPRNISQQLEICGYLALSDIGSPASHSRHLIFPKVEREKLTPNRRNPDKSNNNASTATNTNNSNGTNNNNGNSATSNKSALDVHSKHYEYEKLEHDIREFYGRETDIESGDDGDQSKTSSNNNHSVPEAQRESLCVLLHAALKMESLAGVVLLGENWYGFIYAFADSKKKSNLMLNILPPGNNVIPWLGDLSMLGLPEDLMPGENSSFPVKAEKRSYSQSCVVWIRHVSLQSDVQKVLRHAKKMPEKTQNFFKELNRIRRAALSIGFVELLDAMAVLFEKEIATSSSNTNQEFSLQLQHAANELRKPANRDLKVSIMPLPKLATEVPISSTTNPNSTEFYKTS